MTTTAFDQNEKEASSEMVDAPDVTCAKCKTKTPWNGSSWCPDCGYYPGISDVISEDVRPQEEVEQATKTTLTGQPPLLPGWVKASIGGATAIVVISIAASYYFTYYGGDRSLISFLVFLTGLAVLTGAHLITSVAAMQECSDITPFQIIGNPIEMWRPTIHGLPNTGRRIVCGVCGATAVLSALFIIGGLDFGSVFEKDEVETEKPGIFKRMVTVPADADVDNPEQSLEESLEELEPVVEELDAASAALLPSPDEPLQCVVYGYMNDGKEDFGRLLLAAVIGETRVHVGTMDARKLPKHIRENLAQRLPQLVVDEPYVKSRYNGNWVTPSVAFNVDFKGWSMAGELIKPKISTQAEDANK